MKWYNYTHTWPEHLAKFAGNAKVAKSVAEKNGIIVNIV
jgi:hypothetical protein